MTQLETTEHWAQILELKDQLPLRELATRFETTPGAISAAMRRTGTMRAAITGSAPPIQVQDDVQAAPAPKRKRKGRRSAGRPQWWSEIQADLDSTPISELAARVGVTPGQLAQELKAAGHRRVPVASPAPAPSRRRGRKKKASASTGQQAWQVSVVRGSSTQQLAIIASSLQDAASKAASLDGAVTGLTLVGEVVA